MEIKRNIEAEGKFHADNWVQCQEVLSAVCAKAPEYLANVGKFKNASGIARYYDTDDMQLYRNHGAIRIVGDEVTGLKATVKALYVENAPENLTPKEYLRLATEDGLLVRQENSQEGSGLITDYKELITELFPALDVEALTVKALTYKARTKVKLKTTTSSCEVAIDAYEVVTNSNRTKTRYSIELESINGGSRLLTRQLADMLEHDFKLKRIFSSKYQDVIRAKKSRY